MDGSIIVPVLSPVLTTLMAPPPLRWAMSHLALDEEERLRAIDHATRAGEQPPSRQGEQA